MLFTIKKKYFQDKCGDLNYGNETQKHRNQTFKYTGKGGNLQKLQLKKMKVLPDFKVMKSGNKSVHSKMYIRCPLSQMLEYNVHNAKFTVSSISPHVMTGGQHQSARRETPPRPTGGLSLPCWTKKQHFPTLQ